MTSEQVRRDGRDLASGRWRNDVVEAAALVGATDPDTDVIERPLNADGEVIA